MWKTVLKYLKRTSLGLVLLIVGYFFVAGVLSIISTRPLDPNCSEDREIFITTNGIHLDIILPKEYLKEEIKEDLQINEGTNYVSYGWGDKGFYLDTPTWGDLQFKTAIKALFLRSETAMHVTQYSSKYDRWFEMSICESQLEILIAYVNKSFEKDNQGNIIELKEAGYTNHDKFYEAVGNYNCIQTCNEWVNMGLRKSGIKTSVWSPFDYGVLYQMKKQ